MNKCHRHTPDIKQLHTNQNILTKRSSIVAENEFEKIIDFLKNVRWNLDVNEAQYDKKTKNTKAYNCSYSNDEWTPVNPLNGHQ